MPLYTQPFPIVTIVSQSSLTQKKICNLSQLLVPTSPRILSSPFFLSYLFSFKIHSNPASADEMPAPPLPSNSQPPTITADVASSASIGSQFSISLHEPSQSENTQELSPFSSLLSDVRPLLSRPNHFKLQLDHSALGRQHRREYYTNHARRTKNPALINLYNTVSNQIFVNGKQSFGITNATNIRLKAPFSTLNDWSYHHRQSPHFPADVTKPSRTSLSPSFSIFL